MIPVVPFGLKPTAPFGVPEVVSASFWGGVWGIVFFLILPRFLQGRSYWLASAIIGGLALTFVYMFVVVPFRTGALPQNMGGLGAAAAVARPITRAICHGWVTLAGREPFVLSRKVPLLTQSMGVDARTSGIRVEADMTAGCREVGV